MEIVNQQIEKVKVSYQEYNEFPMYSIYLIMKYIDAIGVNVSAKEQEINGGFENAEMDIRFYDLLCNPVYNFFEQRICI